MTHFYIIVVSYNAGDRLVSTLASISSQTCTDYSVIIKDGSSTDGSVEKAEEFLASNTSLLEKCLFIKGKDAGIYDAMNIAAAAAEELAEKEFADAHGIVYFLNCGDVFDAGNVLEQIKEKSENRKVNGSSTDDSSTDGSSADGRAAILYGDIMEMKTKQRIASNPAIDDFACYRNVPCHQACFYDIELMNKEHFDTDWKVRADYEHFLRCFYIDKAETIYVPCVIADYEGGGFSETDDSRQLSEQERKQIVRMYMSSSRIARYDFFRIITFASLRTAIAENPATSGFYNRLKKILYSLK